MTAAEEKNSNEGKATKGTCLRNSIAGIMVALLFYFGLYLIISSVSAAKRQKDEGILSPVLLIKTS